MISIEEISKTIFSISISEPRSENDEQAFLTFLDEVKQKENFGIILKVDGPKSFGQKSKKELGIWFKVNKNLLRKNCFGFARVTSDLKKIGFFKKKALLLAMPCPYETFSESKRAEEWLMGKIYPGK